MKYLIILVSIILFTNCKGQTETKSKAITTNVEYLSEQELEPKSKEELRLIRNEMFARKGYIFKGKDLQNYFSKQKWYEPNSNISISFTDEEQLYIDKIKSLENGKSDITPKKINCIDFYHKEIEKIYPLTGEKIRNDQLPDKLIDIELPHKGFTDNIMDVLSDGSIFKLDCNENSKYKLIITYYPDQDLHVYLIISDQQQIKKLYGTYVHDFKNVDKYNFILDQYPSDHPHIF